MFKYFPCNYVRNLSVGLAIEIDACIGWIGTRPPDLPLQAIEQESSDRKPR